MQWSLQHKHRDYYHYDHWRKFFIFVSVFLHFVSCEDCWSFSGTHEWDKEWNRASANTERDEKLRLSNSTQSFSIFFLILSLSISCWWWLWQMMSFTQAFYYFSCAFFSLMSLSCRAVVRIAFWIQIINDFFPLTFLFRFRQRFLCRRHRRHQSIFVCIFYLLVSCIEKRWKMVVKSCMEVIGSLQLFH